MKLLIFQKGFNYSQDGPGNRLVYHLQGCNLRCPWCANPEGIRPGGTPMHVGGRERLSCREYGVGELCAEAESCREMFFEGGGVTLTGGEPTLQFEAVREFLECLRGSGIHTAVETNGTHPRLNALLPLIDFLIMDVKHWDGDAHRLATGAGNERTLENLARILEAGRSVAIRIPLIGGFNASAEDMEGFLELFRGLPMQNATVELLRYHEYGKEKWAQCGMAYTMENGFVEPPFAAKMEQRLRDSGIRVIRT